MILVEKKESNNFSAFGEGKIPEETPNSTTKDFQAGNHGRESHFGEGTGIKFQHWLQPSKSE